MNYKIVFSDIDGTLLSSRHKVLPGTLDAILSLERKNIPFVIISARSPSGIYPILQENNFNCPIIAYSGGLIMDADRKILYSKGFSKEMTAAVIRHIETNQMDCTWNIYSIDTWLVKDKSDLRVINEENIVHAQAQQGDVTSLSDGAEVNKVLCMCNPEKIRDIEFSLKAAFPELSITKSSDILLEIMQGGVTKGVALSWLCELWNIPLEAAIAFGDNYNDMEMLETVGMPFLMGNASAELKEKFLNITEDNDNEGISNALAKLQLI